MKPTGLEGRIALVTGGARGIGAAVVRALCEEGARVVAVDSDGAAVAAFAAALAANGATVRGESVDVRDATAVEALVDRIERDWGRSTSARTSPASSASPRSPTPSRPHGATCSP